MHISLPFSIAQPTEGSKEGRKKWKREEGSIEGRKKIRKDGWMEGNKKIRKGGRKE